MNDTILEALRLNNPQLCILSTVNEENKPESAVLVYMVRDDLSIILSTDQNSRKWKNLEKNTDVAISVGMTFTGVNLQIEGTARLVTEGEEFETLSNEYFSYHPEVKQYQSVDTKMILVNPKWVRINDYRQHPPKVDEVTL